MRKRFTFWGKVQGVGFRMTAAEIAKQLSLNGWVKNNPDSSVTLVLEGETEKIELMKQKLQEIFQNYISHLEEKEETAEGITGFRILY